MGRQVRSDITVGSLERKLGVKPGTIKNSDGRDTRSDKEAWNASQGAEGSGEVILAAS